MAYILGQYNKAESDDSLFMSLITQGSPKRRDLDSDLSIQNLGIVFQNECIQVNDSFDTDHCYYFHGKVKRMNNAQVFTVKLVNYNDDSDLEQYIKKIIIGGGNPHEWVDIEFVFSPYTIFDCLLFELQRTSEDYSDEVRYPIIIYQELSVINNILSTKVRSGVELLKIGVQSDPGFLMCINGEEIRINRSGIYEINDDAIVISFFSAINAAKETTTELNTTITQINNEWDTADALPTAAQRQQAKSQIGSRTFLSSEKTREIKHFTLDYLYEED